MPPAIFCYVGGKAKLKKRLIPMFPEHKTYVEPFVGGGAIFFGKPLAERNILNDKNKELMIQYSNLKSRSPTDPNDYPTPNTKEEQLKLLKSNSSSYATKLIQYIIKKCGGFSGRDVTNKVYRVVNLKRKLKHLPKYKEMLKNTSLTSADYKIVIRAHDSPSSFFFLDPPYEKSKGIYKNFNIDYDEMAKLLKSIKGKFMVTINDSEAIRNAFKGFKIKPIIVRGGSGEGLGQTDRNELVITNY